MRFVIRCFACAAVYLLIASVVPARGGANSPTRADAVESSVTWQRVAVTNSWLESCVRDVAGRAGNVETVRLAPPGSCPGHFDMKPGDLARLQDSVALLRFDFQAPIEEHFSRGGNADPRVVVVRGPKGLCVPDRYVAACEYVAEKLRPLLPDLAAQSWEAALADVRERMAALSHEVRSRVEAAGLSGKAVISSAHQAVFCRWLGLNVVATFSAADTVSPAPLEALVAKGRAAGVRHVIGNLQEGARAGEALAHHLGAQLVVFSNFPAMTGEQPDFEQLVRDNVNALERAARQPE